MYSTFELRTHVHFLYSFTSPEHTGVRERCLCAGLESGIGFDRTPRRRGPPEWIRLLDLCADDGCWVLDPGVNVRMGPRGAGLLGLCKVVGSRSEFAELSSLLGLGVDFGRYDLK